jgi:hypothetical protein
MTAKRTRFADITLALPDGWLDITADLSGEVPPTLAKPDGIGVLQLSVARYQGGEEPQVQHADLKRLLQTFFEKHRFGTPTTVKAHTASVMVVSADFLADEEFIRAWYISNGSHVALATYTTNEPHDARCQLEASEGDEIVSSIDFS